jgi:hypothetical protein
MKARLLIGLALSLISALAVSQGERPNLRKDLENYFAKVDTYIEKGNMPAFWALFHPGYYTVDTQGKRMELPAYKQMINGMAKGSKVVDSHIRVKNVQLQDQEAVAWIQHEMTWKEMENGRWVAKKSTTRWAENLVSSGSSWKFRSSQQLITNEPWTFKTNGG